MVRRIWEAMVAFLILCVVAAFGVGMLAMWGVAETVGTHQAVDTCGDGIEETMIALDPTRIHVDRKGIYPWVSCLHPFVENSRGVLIHRPRSGATYNLHKTPHVAVNMWCGHTTVGSGKHLTFLAAPPEGKVLCARCEAAAVEAGLQTADELAGRHVHVGGVKAVITCCEEKP